MATDRGAGAVDAHAPVEALIRHRLSVALGGWRGSVETAVPTVAFVLIWVWQHRVGPAVAAAAVLTVVLAAVRVAQRQSLQFVFSALVATALAAFFALRTGRAQDAFLPGILGSVAFGLGSLLSVVVRWPVVGFLVGAGDPRASEDPFGWRRDAGLVRVCQRLTMVLVGLYAVRVAVMLPLYLAGRVGWLGVAKIGLGWPAYVLAVAVMGWLLVRGHTPHAEPDDGELTPPGAAPAHPD